MSDHDALVRSLYVLVDRRTWPAMAELVTADVTYDRPGYPTINGVAALLDFYAHTRMIAGGAHHLESLLTDEKQGFCWGTFVGVSHEGAPLSEAFADWYEFDGGRVRRRRSFFYRPAI